ncbi:hypothetical protein IGJ74_000861 [Enterococcus sp. AZ009]
MKKQKINLKEYVDEKKITLREISDQTGIKESVLLQSFKSTIK